MPALLVALQVKNSLRAVNDRYEDAEEEPPPVRVVVAEGAEDVCIKVHLLCTLPYDCWLFTCLRPFYLRLRERQRIS